MKDIKSQFKKIEEIKNSDLPEEIKKAQVETVSIEIASLKVKADTIRKDNFTKFQSILTDEQKTELEKIKQEKRQKFGKRGHHKHHMHKPNHKCNHKDKMIHDCCRKPVDIVKDCDCKKLEEKTENCDCKKNVEIQPVKPAVETENK